MEKGPGCRWKRSNCNLELGRANHKLRRLGEARQQDASKHCRQSEKADESAYSSSGEGIHLVL
eukprot:5568657-Pleurochrysis_carterae.AAC.1